MKLYFNRSLARGLLRSWIICLLLPLVQCFHGRVEQEPVTTESMKESSFWAQAQRKGTNFFNKTESYERFISARQLGISWVRLTPSKWQSADPTAKDGDFLFGSSKKYAGLLKQDLEKLREVLDQADRVGLKVVLTFLDVPGAKWRQHNNRKDDLRLWKDFGEQEDAIQFFKDLVIQLKDHPALAGINPINEPCPEKGDIKFEDWLHGDYGAWSEKVKNTPQDISDFYGRLVKAIRRVDANLPIILDTGFYATPWAIKGMTPLDDPNVFYSFHVYEPFAFTNQKGAFIYPGMIPFGEVTSTQVKKQWNHESLREFFEPVRTWQKKFQVPSSQIIVGEFGVYRDAPGAKEYLQDLLDIFDEERWHWAFYSFREDQLARMDYELGTDKKAPYPYWDAIEKGLMPIYRGMKDQSLIDVIRQKLNGSPRFSKPAMGWNSWNWFGRNLDEQLVREVISSLVKTGLRDAGYEYVVVDGGWRDDKLGAQNDLVVNPKKFPQGIKALADLAHASGLKFGLHVAVGTHECGGKPVGSFGHEAQHFARLMELGVDFIKLDQCVYQNTEDWPAEILEQTYRKWAQLVRTFEAEHPDRKINLSLSAYKYQRWYPEFGNSGRTTLDIKPHVFGGSVFDTNKAGEFLSVMDLAELNDRAAPFAGNGYWNDADMLVVGDEGLTFEEQKSHFALWAIMSSPLMLGNDPRSMSTELREVITNKEIIAVNQDPTEQGRRLKKNGLVETWAKQLSDGSLAVLLLNRDVKIHAKWRLDSNLLGFTHPIKVRDFFHKRDLGTFSNPFDVDLKPRSSVLLRVKQDIAGQPNK